jgi:hypothetical protein
MLIALVRELRIPQGKSGLNHGVGHLTKMRPQNMGASTPSL